MKKQLFLAIFFSFCAISSINAQEIFDAVKQDNVAEVTRLLDEGVDLLIQEPETGEPLLHLAFRYNAINTAKLLVERDFPVDTAHFGVTPLHLAFDSPAIAQLLIQHNANIDSQNLRGMTPLHFGAQLNKLEFAEVLIQAGANVNSLDVKHKTPLHYAAEDDSVEIARILLRRGADANIQDNVGYTPLHSAIQSDSTNFSKLLIQGDPDYFIKPKADVNIADNGGNTPLHIAASINAPGITDMLIKAGADLLARNNENDTPLHHAAAANAKDVVELLFKEGVPINIRGSYGTTPLHHAAEHNSVLVVELLIQNGADINAKHVPDNMTPLHSAASFGSQDVARLLIQEEATLDALDFEDKTPLIRAQQSNQQEMVMLLQTAQLNKQLLDAVRDSEQEQVKTLLEQGAQVNTQQNKKRETPLHIAMENRDKKMVSLLIEKGADAAIKDRSGFSPINIAAQDPEFWFPLFAGLE